METQTSKLTIMQKLFFYPLTALLTIVVFSCSPKQEVDTIFHHGVFHIMDSVQSPAEAMAVKDGKIVAVGSFDSLNKLYQATKTIDLNGNHVYPGWHDAHCHYWGYGMTLQQVDLTGTASWEEVIARCKSFYEKYHPSFLIGRGWDQNDWASKDFPSNEQLNAAFPNIPVILKRVDGHAAIANDYLLQLAKISTTTKTNGGEFIQKNGRLTGVLIDNAVDIATKALPETDRQTHVNALLAAQDTCFKYGLTAVTDAGLPTSTLLIIDSLQKAGLLTIRINAMVSIGNDEIDYWTKRGVYETEFLRIGSFKMYADGALGSRGACLIKPYHDAQHHGMMITTISEMQHFVKRVSKSPFQLNTHCIGDSANRVILNLYAEVLGKNNNNRWRIEHAQVLNPSDFAIYKNHKIIPSVQPTHATSDMYWAAERLGIERVKYAYAYQTLLAQNNILPLGTDFPVEQVNPMLTLYAAITRKSPSGFPDNGFNPSEALSFWQAMYGMTIWPAFSAFWENKSGNFSIGLHADFVVYKDDLQQLSPKDYLSLLPEAVFISGKPVHK
jgi:predicted amidohydrolase YtcJ